LSFSIVDLGGDPAEVTGYNGRKYYRLATITWSRPRIWMPGYDFDVPNGWSGLGGVYIFTRHHHNQRSGPQIAYIGKANRFESRLTTRHGRYDIVERQGSTTVSCGRIAFERIRARKGYYEEIEDILILTLWDQLENIRSLESLPGFRQSSARIMIPWVITNRGHSFGQVMPRRIVYPSIGISFS
jgi:hypothetical protein